MRFSLASPRTWLLALAIVAAVVVVGTGCGKDPVSPSSNSLAVTSVGFSTRVISSDAPEIRSAMATQNRVTPDLLRQTGIIGTGTSADEKGHAVILVYTDRPGVSGIAGQIDGIPTRVWNIGRVIPYAKPGGGGPLQMGRSTGNDNECASGTLGCVVVKGGVEYFLSNNHVFARENDASNGERIDAPGRYDGHPACSQTPQCATLSDFQPINFGGSNTIDAAIARPISGLSYTQVSAGGWDPSSTVVSPSVGLAVKKYGRTSGLTTGNIQAINVTITVGYTAGTATFTGQIQTSGQFIRSGDSGSLMVTQSGENPVGLCFAGSSQASFANQIGPVLQKFGATVK